MMSISSTSCIPDKNTSFTNGDAFGRVLKKGVFCEIFSNATIKL